jgi:UDPglucose--hexose-1-phosphate uridylyltransferase
MTRSVEPLLADPHRRYNPLLDEWVLCSPHRLNRPWQGSIEPAPRPAGQTYDPNCYLCPGNERAGGHRNPDYAHVYAFDNDFPALLMSSSADGANLTGNDFRTRHAGDGERGAPRGAEATPVIGALGRAPRGVVRRQDPPRRGFETAYRDLLHADPAHGVCRVLCFSPHHELTLARMPVSDIALVVDAWAEEVERLGRDPNLQYVQVFENKGEMMGASNPHPHGQIWATAHVPMVSARKTASQRAYFASHRRDLLGDYLVRELAAGERIVAANDHWVVLVPFWAVWPFETMILPRRKVADLPSLEREERGALAAIMRELLVRYDNLFETPFPYTMGWHGQPLGDPDPAWRLHATYNPPLLRSATVRKFLVGFEQMAEPQRDLTAEQAAQRLRSLSSKHYLTV